MKRKQALLMVFSACVILGAYAQELKVSTRRDCNERCNAHYSDPDKSPPKYITKLNRIRDAIAKEGDPEKLKELREQEKQELEKYLDGLERRCSEICQYNPD